MIRLRRVSFLAAILSVSVAAKATNDHPHIQMSMDYLFGNQTGYIQIPQGGQPGTTTPEAPTLDAIHLQKTGLLNLYTEVMGSHWGVYGRYQIDRDSQQATLQRDLLTHKTFYPMGSKVLTNTQFDLAYYGGIYDYPLQSIPLHFRILTDVAILRFYYDISDSETGRSTSRTFTSLTPRLGLGLQYDLSNNIWVTAEGMGSLDHMTSNAVYEANARLHINVLTTQHMQANVFTGVAYQYIEFKDGQLVPNHILLHKGPLLSIGMALNFL